MKRYEHCKVLNRMISAPDGEWVKYEDAKKLKELNREMVEALKAVTDNYYDDYTLPKPVVLHVRNVLRKARGEGE